jgi:hypothetical protein
MRGEWGVRARSGLGPSGPGPSGPENSSSRFSCNVCPRDCAAPRARGATVAGAAPHFPAAACPAGFPDDEAAALGAVRAAAAAAAAAAARGPLGLAPAGAPLPGGGGEAMPGWPSRWARYLSRLATSQGWSGRTVAARRTSSLALWGSPLSSRSSSA